MSERRSTPAPIPDHWFLRPLPVELRWRTINLRQDDQGRWLAGDDPWFDCSGCGLVRDTAQFRSCPFCIARAAAVHRQRAAEYWLEQHRAGHIH